MAWGNDGTFGDQYAAADLKDVYAAAMKQGLNLWDTAVVYGMGTSENILGELTKDTPQKDLILSTKFTPQIEDGTAEAMQNMLNGSKERLHADVIDIYWIHNPMDVEKYTPMLIPLAIGRREARLFPAALRFLTLRLGASMPAPPPGQRQMG